MTSTISRKSLMVLVAALLAMAIFAISSNAASAQISTYTSGFQVQNLDQSADADVVMTFYKQDGSVEATVPDTISAGSSTTYFPLPASVGAGFNGSAVISSDKPVAAIANVIGDGVESSSYSGFSGGSNEVGLPLVMKDNFGINTWFNVQNAGSAAATVTVSYAGTSCTESETVQPGAAATFDQSSNGCLPAGYVNSATIETGSASDSIVASVLQVSSGGLLAYNGFGTGSTEPVMPLIAANNFGTHTGTQIQNQGDSSTEVTLTYTPAIAGTACTETKTIAAGASETFSLYAFSLSGPTSSNCTFGEWFVGSAQVTGNTTSQPLVAVVNQTDFSAQASAYNSFDPAQATSTVVMPLIMDAFGLWTGYNIINVGSGSTTVTCSYSGLAASENDTATLAPGEAMNAVQLNSGFPANTSGGYVGGGTCTATGSGAILGVVNQVQTGATNDGTLTHEAFNQ